MSKLDQALSKFTTAMTDQESGDPGCFERAGIELEIHDSRYARVVPANQWQRQIQHWALIGIILRSGYGTPHPGCQKRDDSAILADPVSLHGVIQACAKFLWPLWLASR